MALNPGKKDHADAQWPCHKGMDRKGNGTFDLFLAYNRNRHIPHLDIDEMTLPLRTYL